MTVAALKDITNGETISFRSKDPSDLVDWRGTLESTGTFRSVRGYGDPRAQNERVRQVDPTVPSDVTELNFFLITVDNKSSAPQIYLFAEEWIVPGSLQKVALASQVSVRIDDPFSDPVKILGILAEHGYSSKII